MSNDCLHPERVRRHFSGSALSYEKHAVVQPRVVALMAEKLKKVMPLPKGAVVDVGTGTGAMAKAFVERYERNGLLLGCDIAPAMCRQAAEKVPGLVPLVADARMLPLTQESCALVMSASVYQWVEDLPAAFAEVARILGPGGGFALALFGARTLYELKAAYRQARQDAGQSGDGHLQRFPDVTTVNEALCASGSFEVLDLGRAFECEWHPDVQTLLRGLKGIGAHNASRHQPRGLASRQKLAAMIGHYRRLFGSSKGVPATYEIVYALARKKG